MKSHSYPLSFICINWKESVYFGYVVDGISNTIEQNRLFCSSIVFCPARSAHSASCNCWKYFITEYPTNSRIGNCTYLPVQCSHNLTDIPNHDYQCTLAHTKRFNMKLQLFFVVSLFLTFHPHLLHPVFDIHTDELTKKQVSEYLGKCCGTCTVLPPGGGGNWPRSMWATLIFKIHLANKKSHPSNRRVLVFGVRTCSEAHKRIPHSLFPPVLR